MVTLSEPCQALAEGDPLTVGADDLVRDIADQIKDVHYRAVVAVDRDGKPIGVVTRSDLVNPTPRRVILVDHGERAQSVAGIEEAEIVEIIDHHHIGSIETKLPVRAIFDPVGSTVDARRRALPPGGRRALRGERDDAARRDRLRHRPADLADDDRSRPASRPPTSSGC